MTAASDVILRGPRASRADIYNAPALPRSLISSTSPAPIFDASTLVLTGSWQADYTASPGDPWPATASAGTSLANGGLTNIGFIPSVGALANGKASADFNGSSSALGHALELDAFFTVSAMSISGVVAADTVAARTVGAGYADAPIVTQATNGLVYVTYTADGICFGIYDSVTATFKEVFVACPADGLPHTFHAWFSGGFIDIRVDGVGPISGPVACNDTLPFAGLGTLQVGRNYDGTVFLDGRVWDLKLSDGDLGATSRTNLESNFQDTYFTTPPPVTVTLLGGHNIGLAAARTSLIDVWLSPGLQDPPAPQAEVLYFFGYGVFPDSVSRRALDAAWQLPQARHEEPIVVEALTPLPGIEYPDAVRPSRAETPSGATIVGKPERASPIAGREVYPDIIARRLPHASAQQATALDARPDPRTVQFADVIAPAAVDRRWLPAAAQLATEALQAFPDARTSPFVDVTVQAFVRRVVMSAAVQLAHASSPKPDQTVAFARADGPSEVRRAAMHASAQLHVTALSPRPEHMIALDAPPYFPAAIARVLFLADRQQAIAWPVKPDRTAPFVGGEATFPAAVGRVVLPAACGQVVAWHPLPDLRIVPIVDAANPRQVRPAATVTHMLPPWAAPVEPPGAAPAAPTFYGAQMPAWLPAWRPAPTSPVGPPAQGPVFAPTFFAALAPSSLPQARAQQPLPLAPPYQPAPPAAPLLPLLAGLAPLFRPRAPITYAGLVAGVVAKERALPATDGSWPDRPARARPPVQSAGQAAGSSFPIVAPVGLVVCPDGVTRQVFHPSRPGAFVLGRGERKAPFAEALYPARVARHPEVEAHAHPAFTFAPRPIPLVPTSLTTHPDAVVRPSLHASSQQCFPLGAFDTPAATLRLPACLSGVLTLETSLAGELVEETVYAATLAIATSAFGALSESTLADGELALDASVPGATEGCDE